ncbi:MAG: homoserine dehydrogenase [Alicyclobacillaceae bacterium]|nr:homoserine dehydrogenase [Alicyclobacillaceae bacterium]
MDVYIGLLGCGTVGSGVIELTRRRSAKIADLTGLRPVIKRVLVRDVHKARDVAVEHDLLTDRAEDILHDDEISIVVETIGGIEPAKTFILEAIRGRKHVVTANKDLIALCGQEILEVAEQNGVDVYYEAAVGGAIPVIRPLKECLTANNITDLKGIINGTTNYILSKMTETGASFEEALREAQELGYAEADPSSDVDGLDAARKLTILASIAFQTRVRLEDVRVTGIRGVTATDVAYAQELGAVIKLLAVGKDRDGILTLEVRPTLVPKHHPLASVSGSFNALFVTGDAAGDLLFFGRGAGSLPTASSVVGDVIDCLRNIKLGVSGRVGEVLMFRKRVDPAKAEPVSHYLRLQVEDQPGVFARIAAIFGDAAVSMETVVQKRARGGHAEIVVVTHKAAPVDVDRVVEALRALPSVRAVAAVMPVESNGDT